MSDLDYDAVRPFREMLHRTLRKRHLRARQRMAFEVGGGLAEVDHWLVRAYAKGQMHPSRLGALTHRLRHDPTFREYAEPRIEMIREWEALTPAQREEKHGGSFESMPQSPLDRRIEARAVHAVLLAAIPVVPGEELDSEYDPLWPNGEDLDFELEQELEEELMEPLDCDLWSAPVAHEAYANVVSWYVRGELGRRERRAVEARVMCDPVFAEAWGEPIRRRLERQVRRAEA